MKRNARGAAFAACLIAAGLLGGCGGEDVVSSYAKAASIDVVSDTETASSGDAPSPAAVSSVRSAAESSETLSASGNTAAENAENGNAQALPQTMTASDGIGAISVPANWENLDGQIEDTLESFTIKAGSPDDGLYLMYSTESSVSTPIPDLQAYFNTIISSVTTNSQLSDISRQTDDSLTLANGYPAIRTAFTAAYRSGDAADGESAAGQMQLAYWIYAVQAGDYYCQFNCWTNAENAASAGETFDAIVNSLAL